MDRKGVGYLLQSYAKLEAELKEDVFLLVAGEGEKGSVWNRSQRL